MSCNSSAFTTPGNSRAWVEYESCSPDYNNSQRNRQPSIWCDGEEDTYLSNEELKKKGTKKSGKRVNYPRRKTWTGDGTEGDRCPICLDAFLPCEELVITPCTHLFHGDCLAPWVKEQGKCPVCRQAISEKKKAVK